MAFLQVKNNLYDLQNVKEAHCALGLGSMAFESKNNINITGGSITVDNFCLTSGSNTSNYVMMSDSNGCGRWVNLPVASWAQREIGDINLSEFNDDLDLMSQTDINTLIDNKLLAAGDGIDLSTISSSNIFTSNIYITHDLIFSGSNSNNLKNPSVIMNSDSNGTMQWIPLINSYQNNAIDKVPTAAALNDLYWRLQMDITSITGGNDNMSFLNSTNNLSDVSNITHAVYNLGINDNFATSNLTIKDTIYIPNLPSGQGLDTGTKYFLVRGLSGFIGYEEIIEKTFPSTTNNRAPTAAALSNVYFTLQGNIDQTLKTNNYLSELIPYKTQTVANLKTIGLQLVAFTSDFEDLINKPTRLSSFCNDERFIKSDCNLLDLDNKTQAMVNLGISQVGITGNFFDFDFGNCNLMPAILSNIIRDTDVPYLKSINYLSELNHNTAYVHSNLQLGTMATQNHTYVHITGGEAYFTSNVSINGPHFKTLPSNLNVNLSDYNTKNIFLKCQSSDGEAKWTYLPEANAQDDTLGSVYLTNTLSVGASNYAITAYAFSNAIYNDIANNFPIATECNYGIVRITNNPIIHNVSDMCIDVIKYNTDKNDIDTDLVTLSNDIVDLENYLNTTVANAISDLQSNIDTKVETISGTFPINVTLLTDAQADDKQYGISIGTTGDDTQYLDGKGFFSTPPKTTLSLNGVDPISGDFTFTGNGVTRPSTNNFNFDITTITNNATNLLNIGGTLESTNTYKDAVTIAFDGATTQGQVPMYKGTNYAWGSIVGANLIDVTYVNDNIQISTSISNIIGEAGYVAELPGLVLTNGQADSFLNGIGGWTTITDFSAITTFELVNVTGLQLIQNNGINTIVDLSPLFSAADYRVKVFGLNTNILSLTQCNLDTPIEIDLNGLVLDYATSVTNKPDIYTGTDFGNATFANYLPTVDAVYDYIDKTDLSTDIVNAGTKIPTTNAIFDYISRTDVIGTGDSDKSSSTKAVYDYVNRSDTIGTGSTTVTPSTKAVYDYVNRVIDTAFLPNDTIGDDDNAPTTSAVINYVNKTNSITGNGQTYETATTSSVVSYVNRISSISFPPDDSVNASDDSTTTSAVINYVDKTSTVSGTGQTYETATTRAVYTYVNRTDTVGTGESDETASTQAVFDYVNRISGASFLATDTVGANNNSPTTSAVINYVDKQSTITGTGQTYETATTRGVVNYLNRVIGTGFANDGTVDEDDDAPTTSAVINYVNKTTTISGSGNNNQTATTSSVVSYVDRKDTITGSGSSTETVSTKGLYDYVRIYVVKETVGGNFATGQTTMPTTGAVVDYINSLANYTVTTFAISGGIITLAQSGAGVSETVDLNNLNIIESGSITGATSDTLTIVQRNADAGATVSVDMDLSSLKLESTQIQNPPWVVTNFDLNGTVLRIYQNSVVVASQDIGGLTIDYDSLSDLPTIITGTVSDTTYTNNAKTLVSVESMKTYVNSKIGAASDYSINTITLNQVNIGGTNRSVQLDIEQVLGAGGTQNVQYNLTTLEISYSQLYDTPTVFTKGTGLVFPVTVADDDRVTSAAMDDFVQKTSSVSGSGDQYETATTKCVYDYVNRETTVTNSTTTTPTGSAIISYVSRTDTVGSGSSSATASTKAVFDYVNRTSDSTFSGTGSTSETANTKIIENLNYSLVSGSLTTGTNMRINQYDKDTSTQLNINIDLSTITPSYANVTGTPTIQHTQAIPLTDTFGSTSYTSTDIPSVPAMIDYVRDKVQEVSGFTVIDGDISTGTYGSTDVPSVDSVTTYVQTFVVNSTAGNETDSAPSVNSIKSYITNQVIHDLSYGAGNMSLTDQPPSVNMMKSYVDAEIAGITFATMSFDTLTVNNELHSQGNTYLDNVNDGTTLDNKYLTLDGANIIIKDYVREIGGGTANTVSGTKSSVLSGDSHSVTHNNSTASGTGAVTGTDDQFICGKYNESSTNASFIVGNGTNSGSRNNLFEVGDDSGGYVQISKKWRFRVDGNEDLIFEKYNGSSWITKHVFQ